MTKAKPSRMRQEILQLAHDMRAAGATDDAVYRKITMRGPPVAVVAMAARKDSRK
ncbi:MAG: hypothetical protein WDN46_06690 [Methylocella sp.]